MADLLKAEFTNQEISSAPVVQPNGTSSLHPMARECEAEKREDCANAVVGCADSSERIVPAIPFS